MIIGPNNEVTFWRLLLMEKIDVVLIVLNRNVLDDALKILNFNRINLAAIVMDNFDVDLFQLADSPCSLSSATNKF